MKKDQDNIIERCIDGDIKAQFLLYKQYSKAMYNIAIRFLNNSMDAEDILQESFVTVFEKIGTLDRKSAFGSWLKRIVINNCISFLRKNRVFFEEVDDYPDYQDDQANPFFAVDPAVIHENIRKLPDGARTVLVLYALEGYNHREIAEMLSITDSTSRTQYKRALGLLSKSLKSEIYVN